MTADRCTCPAWKPGSEFIDGCIAGMATRYGRREGNVFHYGPTNLKPWCHCPWCGSALAPLPPSEFDLDWGDKPTAEPQPTPASTALEWDQP